MILFGFLRIRPALTPLAAAGPGLIMSGARVLTPTDGEVALALIPLAHARSAWTGVIVTTQAHQRHERG